MRPSVRPVALLVALASATVGLAGCLQPDGPGADDEPQFVANREMSITFGADFFEAAIAQDQERMKEIVEDALRLSLVVHVASAGDYVLRYTDRDGVEREARLDGMVPGRPHEVTNVDPLKPATLLSGSEVVAQRRALEGEWWTAADVPLGVSFGDGASAAYRASGTTSYGAQVRDIELPEGAGRIDSASFDVSLPTEGSLSWTRRVADGEGVLDLEFSAGVAPSSGDYLKMDVAGTFQGEERSSMSLRVPEVRLHANGSARLFHADGALTGAQSLGGAAQGGARMLVWGTGPLAQAGGSADCPDAMSEENPCEVPGIPSFDAAVGPGERVEVPDEVPTAQDGAFGDVPIGEALANFRESLGADLMPGDRSFAEGSYTHDGSSFAFRFELAVAARERVTVPAGSFDALRVTQLLESSVDVRELAVQGETVLGALEANATFWRSTMWIDAETFVPLKVESEMPFDANDLLHRFMDAAKPSLDRVGLEMPPDSFTLTTTLRNRIELERLSGETRFAPNVGLALAALMANGGFTLGGFAVGGFVGMSQGMVESEPIPISMSLVQERAAGADGASFAVAAVSGGAAWGDVSLFLDDELLYQVPAEGCEGAEGPVFVVCRYGEALSESDPIQPGDSIVVPGAYEDALLELWGPDGFAVVRLVVR